MRCLPNKHEKSCLFGKQNVNEESDQILERIVIREEKSNNNWTYYEGKKIMEKVYYLCRKIKI